MKKPCVISAHVEDELLICVTFSKLGVISQRHHCSRGGRIQMPSSLISTFHSPQFSMHGVKQSQRFWLARPFPKTFISLGINLMVLPSVKLIVKLRNRTLTNFLTFCNRAGSDYNKQCGNKSQNQYLFSFDSHNPPYQ